MAKWLDPYDYKGEDELTVTVTLAEYRELLQCKVRNERESDGEYINRLKLSIKELGGMVPVRLDSIGGEPSAETDDCEVA